VNLIHISDVKPGMKFRNIFGEHYDTIAEVYPDRGVIKCEHPYHGYAGTYYHFAIDRIEVQNAEGEYCRVDEKEKAE
jgi:hypothetical protein